MVLIEDQEKLPGQNQEHANKAESYDFCKLSEHAPFPSSLQPQARTQASPLMQRGLP